MLYNLDQEMLLWNQKWTFQKNNFPKDTLSDNFQRILPPILRNQAHIALDPESRKVFLQKYNCIVIRVRDINWRFLARIVSLWQFGLDRYFFDSKVICRTFCNVNLYFFSESGINGFISMTTQLVWIMLVYLESSY